ncbi:MAG TPA: pyruvate dehydrogenase complex dihydrolipoamide acetyltransferase [Longimicrobiaceae bacterium]|nr:pyruvate dehydrogenase complex dihydrolipoamide acetyltransferase [Longimicrobiaceae bacterium]
MATKVYMEALSPTMEEGRLASWLKNEGDEVKEGDVLAEVETDKATMELVARGAGVLRKRLIGDGDTAAVGSVIGVIAAPDEDISGLIGAAVVAEEAPTTAEAPPAAEVARAEQAGDVGVGAAAVAATGRTEPGQLQRATEEGAVGSLGIAPVAGAGDGRVKASPLARRLAEEAGLEIGGVQGSGPGGRIVKRDIEAALQAAPAAVAAAPQAAAPAAPVPAPAAGYTEVPLSPMRKVIARRLAQSIGPVPTFYLTVEVDMAEAMALRGKLNERFADEGVRVSPNDLVIKAVAMALLRHPMVNASWTDTAIRQYDAAHIGVAVAIEDGLITPVIRDAHRKGITEIAREVKELAGRAREKKLTPEEYTGSTFSISNLGMFGITEFTAIINPPEAAILAVGAIEEKPVAEGGEVTIRPRMRITMSCDHRVIDGATGAQFLQTLQRYLEDPMMMIA